MSYRCDRCGKRRLIGRNVSHSKQRTRKISLPNLHPFKGVLPGKKGLPAGRQGKWKLCTKCLRTVKKALGEPSEKEEAFSKKEFATGVK